METNNKTLNTIDGKTGRVSGVVSKIPQRKASAARGRLWPEKAVAFRQREVTSLEVASRAPVRRCRTGTSAARGGFAGRSPHPLRRKVCSAGKK